MIKDKKITKAGFFFLLFISAIVLQIILNQYYRNQYSEEYLSQEMNTFLEEQSQRMDKVLDRMIQMDSTEIEQFIHQKNGSIAQKTAKQYLVYENDQLVSWSNNRIPVKQKYEPFRFDSSFEQFANAYTLIQKKEQNNKVVIGMLVIKNKYPHENEYLQNDFHHSLNIPSSIEISEQKTKSPVTFNGETVFYLKYPERIILQDSQHKLLFVLFVVALLFLFAVLYHGHRFLNPFPSRPRLFVLFYSIDVIIVRLIISYFKFPGYIHQSELFDPAILGFSSFIPSLGDMFFTALTVLAIAIAIYKDVHLKLPKNNTILNILVNTTIFVVLIIALKMVYGLITSMVMHSSIMLNLHRVFSVDFFTIIAFLALFMVIASLYLILVKLLRFAENHSSIINTIYALLIAAALYLFLSLFWNSVDWSVFPAIFGLLVLFVVEKYYLKSFISTAVIAINLLVFTAIITFLLQYNNQQKEREQREVGASQIAAKQDPVAESLFLDIEEKIIHDDTLEILLEQYHQDGGEDLVMSYILHQYFRGYWDRYNIQLTLCKPTDELVLSSEGITQNCDDFFDRMINENGYFTFSKNLFYLNKDPWFSSYIARLNLPAENRLHNVPYTLYIEMDAKFAPEGLVYPELLIDKDVQRSDLFSKEYSIAKYKNGELIASIGDYSYVIDLEQISGKKNNQKHFYNHNDYSHYYYPMKDGEAIIISKKKHNFWEMLAPFAYILVFLLLFFLIIALIIKPDLFRVLNKNFKSRMQLVMFVVVLISFFFIGILSVKYLYNISQEKNAKQLEEKAHSILIEVEHKISGTTEIDSSMYSYVNNLMYKFASVFFSDINMYDTKGKLIATSRPEIYDNGLMSKQMNSELLHQIKHQERTILINKEKLGELEYSSAYMPFRNNENEVIAYLNLPYYAKQSELEREITGFLASFINIYVLLLAISMALAFLLSNYFTRPLNLIKAQMRKIKLGASNEKIYWNKEDEIGELIQEYNKMIDELERNADLLMRSQKESAWREMAKQVAHEIKNPLTPMKLNIQMLQRAYDSNDPNWEQKLKNVTDSLIDQIDNLAAIASEFSDFAKMPVSKPEVIDLEEVLSHAIDLYSNYEHVRVYYNNYAENTYVRADYKHLTRVFNNILDNAIYAIPKEKTGEIQIRIEEEEDKLIVSIADNGRGIPVEKRDNIFSPSFTTKSSGMGLGLTMVKNIVNNSGGNVWFDSIENEGTTFYVELPQFKE
ncbi:MAG: GHKL domain-containing protein [Bacteroidales bacterium]|nr:GHKL domain-containing protein [Bacteroidales bacterium]MCF8326656.1 GHKL domain-containing protein [Bacteroidales bacterium]